MMSQTSRLVWKTGKLLNDCFGHKCAYFSCKRFKETYLQSKKRIDLEINNKQSFSTNKNIFVSSMSIWEIYLLVKKNKLELAMDVETWVNKIENFGFIQFVPVDNKIAAKSVMLPDTIGPDPADRIIVATAIGLGAALITSDARIRKYRHVQSIW